MKNKNYLVAALLLAGALVFPYAVPAAERDMMKDDKGGMEKGMMKDDKGMMKDQKGMMKDQKGMMKEGKDAMMKDKMKTEKSGKSGMSDDKMKSDDMMKMEQKK